MELEFNHFIHPNLFSMSTCVVLLVSVPLQLFNTMKATFLQMQDFAVLIFCHNCSIVSEFSYFRKKG